MHAQAIEFFSVLNKNCPEKRKQNPIFGYPGLSYAHTKFQYACKQLSWDNDCLITQLDLRFIKKNEKNLGQFHLGLMWKLYNYDFFLMKIFSVMSKREKKLKTSMITFLQTDEICMSNIFS